MKTELDMKIERAKQKEHEVEVMDEMLRGICKGYYRTLDRIAQMEEYYLFLERRVKALEESF